MTTTQRPVPIDRPRRYSARAGLLRMDRDRDHATRLPASTRSSRSSVGSTAMSSQTKAGVADGAGPSATYAMREHMAPGGVEAESSRNSHFGSDSEGNAGRVRSDGMTERRESGRGARYIRDVDQAAVSDPSCSSRPPSPRSISAVSRRRSTSNSAAFPADRNPQETAGYTLRSRHSPSRNAAAGPSTPATPATAAAPTIRHLRPRHSLSSSSSTTKPSAEQDRESSPAGVETEMARSKVRKTARVARSRLRDADLGMYSGAESDRGYSSSLSGLSDSSYFGQAPSQGKRSRSGSEGRSEAMGSDDGASASSGGSGSRSGHDSQASGSASFISTPTSSSDDLYTSTPLGRSSKRSSGKRKNPYAHTSTSTTHDHPTSRPRSRSTRTTAKGSQPATRTTRSTRPTSDAFITLETIHDEKTFITAEVRRLGLTMFHVKGDGSCFFRACSYSLFGHQGHHKLLRQATCDHVLRNKEALRVFEAGLEGVGSMEELVDKMRGYSYYAQGPIPMALAEMIGWDLWLVQANHSHKISSSDPNLTSHPRRVSSPGFAPLDVPPPAQGKTALWLSFQLMGAHYTSICMPLGHEHASTEQASPPAASSSTATASLSAASAPTAAEQMAVTEATAQAEAMPKRVERALVPDSYMQPHAGDQSTEARAWRARQAGASVVENGHAGECMADAAADHGIETKIDIDTSTTDTPDPSVNPKTRQRGAHQYRDRPTSPTTSAESADTSLSHSTTTTEPASPSAMSSASTSVSGSTGSSAHRSRAGPVPHEGSTSNNMSNGKPEESQTKRITKPMTDNSLARSHASPRLPGGLVAGAKSNPEKQHPKRPAVDTDYRPLDKAQSVALENDGFYIDEYRSARPTSTRPRPRPESSKVQSQRRGSEGGASVISVHSSIGGSCTSIADGMEVEEIIA